MLSENGQALVAIVAIFLAFGVVKAFARQILFPLIGGFIVVLLVDHFVPQIALLTTIQSWWVYFEAQLPPDLWAQVASWINYVSDALVQIFSSAAVSNLTESPAIPTPPSAPAQ